MSFITDVNFPEGIQALSVANHCDKHVRVAVLDKHSLSQAVNILVLFFVRQSKITC